MSTSEATPRFKPVERGRKVTAKQYDEQKFEEKRKKTGEFHQFKIEDCGSRGIIPSSIFEGYAAGSIVSLLGSPKVGKTSFALQECIEASRQGFDSLYIYNESPRRRFVSIVKKKMDSMKLGETDLNKVTLCNMSGEVLGSANYANIDSYMRRVWAGKVKYWLEGSLRKPRFVVIDSVSKIGRVYIPQLFKVMEVLCDELTNILDDAKKYPVILIVHQKSGGYWEKFDDSVVGGAGLVHETDTTINLKRLEVNKKLSDDTGLRWGSKLYTITIDSRDVDCSPFERIIELKDGYLKVGGSLFEVAEHTEHFKNKHTRSWND